MRLIAFVWKFLIGTLLCLTPFTAVLVLGWTGRAMQRSALRTWYRQSEHAGSSSFAETMSASDETSQFAKWPNWIVSQRFRLDLSSAFSKGMPLTHRIGRLFFAFFGSLWTNLTLGLQLIINCWVITLPACALWLLGWWAGWENSFSKGYEQAWVGPTVALIGVAVFIAAMIHLPLAQARQAVTGQWRSFYDFSLSHRLRQLGRFSTLLLVILYLAAGTLVTGAKIAPLGIGNFVQGLEQPLSTENLQLLRFGWELAVASLVFMLFVGLHLIAARHYAQRLSAGVADGHVMPETLRPAEHGYLERFGLAKPGNRMERGLIMRSIAWSGGSVGAMLLLFAVIAGWGAFSFQLFFGQFLNHNWIGWLNLALVQLPWLP
ncbi:MAG: hypothetical protein AB3N20_07935 [Rhizobiaceae bacterium]